MYIAVCGVGRSGTSLNTMIIAALGLDPGDPAQMRPADEKNPLGYYELVPLLYFFSNRKTKVNIAESDLDFYAPDWETRPEMPELIADARELWSQLRTSDNMVFKMFNIEDTRPLWEKAIGEELIYVVPFREPYESSVSLQDFNAGKDQFESSLSNRLHRWATTYRGLVRTLQGRRVFFVEYGQLLAEPDRVLGELATALVEWGACPPGVDVAPARALIRPSLHRNRDVVNWRTRFLKPRTKYIYKALRELEGRHDALHVDNPVFWRDDAYSNAIARARVLLRPLRKAARRLANLGR